MGAAPSKPDTKVLTPSAPVEFSASFLSQLENSPESNYSRAQYTEKYIQDRVALELGKLEKEALQQLKKLTDESLDKDTTKLEIPGPNDKLASLTKTLEENAKASKVEVSPELQSVRENVILCLKTNNGKPLNCWDEVTEFQKLVRNT